MLFIHILLQVYGWWQMLGALRVLIGLCACLIICFPAGIIDAYRWVRDRKKRLRAQARLEKFDRDLDRMVFEVEENDPEDQNYDENGVPYNYDD